MRQIYPDSGLLEMLKRIIEPSIKFRIFTNNYTIERETTLEHLTEAAFGGYVPVNRILTDFTLNTVAGHKGTMIASSIAFKNTSLDNQAAHGYYATNAANTILLFAANFDTRPTVVRVGNSFVVIPIIGDFSEFFD